MTSHIDRKAREAKKPFIARLHVNAPTLQDSIEEGLDSHGINPPPAWPPPSCSPLSLRPRLRVFANSRTSSDRRRVP